MTDRTCDWRCDCGKMRARIGLSKGTRIVCACKDCQAHARHLGRVDRLDARSGTDLLLTTVDRVEMLEGQEHLRSLRLTKKGPVRWYAGCCGTPFVNSAGTRGVPHAGVIVWNLTPQDALPPVAARMMDKGAPKSGAPAVVGAIVRHLSHVAGARLSGRHKSTPFFDAVGAPVSEPKILDEAERRAAYLG